MAWLGPCTTNGQVVGEGPALHRSERCTAARESRVLDEPTSAPDVSVQQVLKLLSDLQRRYGLSCIFISHGLASVHAMSHRVMVMMNGDAVGEGEAEAWFAAPRQPYTQELPAAADRDAATG